MNNSSEVLIKEFGIPKGDLNFILLDDSDFDRQEFTNRDRKIIEMMLEDYSHVDVF